MTAIPFYEEHYRLITSAEGVLGDRDSVTWAEVGSVPLCLLTPDMQNRRIIDGLLAGAGARPVPTLESNSVIVLFSHVRTGRWASVMPERLASTLGPDRPGALDPDRRARSLAHDRPRRAAPRADDAAGAGARRRSPECGGETSSHR